MQSLSQYARDNTDKKREWQKIEVVINHPKHKQDAPELYSLNALLRLRSSKRGAVIHSISLGYYMDTIVCVVLASFFSRAWTSHIKIQFIKCIQTVITRRYLLEIGKWLNHYNRIASNQQKTKKQKKYDESGLLLCVFIYLFSVLFLFFLDCFSSFWAIYSWRFIFYAMLHWLINIWFKLFVSRTMKRMKTHI